MSFKQLFISRKFGLKILYGGPLRVGCESGMARPTMYVKSGWYRTKHRRVKSGHTSLLRFLSSMERISRRKLRYVEQFNLWVSDFLSVRYTLLFVFKLFSHDKYSVKLINKVTDPKWKPVLNVHGSKWFFKVQWSFLFIWSCNFYEQCPASNEWKASRINPVCAEHDCSRFYFKLILSL